MGTTDPFLSRKDRKNRTTNQEKKGTDEKLIIDDNGIVGQIPERLISLSHSFSQRKDGRRSLLLLYTIILHQYQTELKRRKRKKKETQFVFVPIGKEYFRKVVCFDYKPKLDFLIDNGFVIRKTKMIEDHVSGVGLFGDTIWKDEYIVGVKPCSYRILEFPTENDQEMTFPCSLEFNEYTKKNINFLKSIGVTDLRLSRDNYGYRLYHNLSNNYKEELPKHGSFVYYDIKSSIPNQIRIKIENIDPKDPFLELFDGDFYDNWNKVLNLGMSERKKIKTHFTFILFGKKGDVSPEIRRMVSQKFPLFLNLVKKDLGKQMVMKETQLVLEEVVGNLPIERVLTIHDGFIVYPESESIIDSFLSEKRVVVDFGKTTIQSV